MNLRLIYVLILLFITTNIAVADDDRETSWPIEEHCVPEPTQPPEGWTFDGTIITTGWAGIHGINAAWETPHILAFNDGWIPEGGYGTLSSDGRWYVIPQANYRSGPYILRGYIDVTRLLIYDLTDSQNILRSDWDDSYELCFGSSASRYYTFRTPVWLDEDTIVYQRDEKYYFVHVPGLIVEEWADPYEWEEVSPVWVYISHPSPDWSRIVIRTQLFNTETNKIVAQVYNATANIDLPSIAWHPNSNEFILAGGLSTTIFDENGHSVDIVSVALDDKTYNYTRIEENAYSPNGTVFWLTLSKNSHDHLALANRANRIIIDTCIDNYAKTIQFSPDGQYLALLSYEQEELQIFDIENWQLYYTGIYHGGTIIGWRAD